MKALLVLPSIRRNSMIARKFNMTNTMAVMANWHKILYFSIFSIAINMVNYKDASIKIAAVMAFSFICFPCIFLIASRHLRCKRFFIPVFKPTNIITIFATIGIITSAPFGNIKGITTIKTIYNLAFFTGLLATFSRTKLLFQSVRFFCHKFNFTLTTCIMDWRIRFSFKLFQSKMVTMGKFCTTIFNWRLTAALT